MNKVSEIFTDALPGGGNVNVECQCGMLHLCPDNERYDFDGEPGSWKAYCESEYADHPKKVTLHYGYDAVTFKEIDDRIYAYGCECWDQLARYENWIWNNREIIRVYLKNRVNRELELAEQEKLLNILMDTRLAV